MEISDEVPLAYLDTNILGMIDAGKLSLPSSGFRYAFSAEHLTEFSRGTKFGPLLTVLSGLEAWELEIALDDKFQITDSAQLVAVADFQARYAQHVASMAAGRQHIELFQQVIAKGFGALNDDAIRANLATLPESIKVLSNHDPDLVGRANDVATSLMGTIDTLSANAVAKLRRAGGVETRVVSNLRPGEAVNKIWELFEAKFEGGSRDLLFGKEAPFGQTHWPRYNAILACYGALNVLGYHADSRLNQLEGTARAQSDGIHLANAAFCHFLLTADRNFAWKATAVLSYLGVGTVVLLVEEKG